MAENTTVNSTELAIRERLHSEYLARGYSANRIATQTGISAKRIRSFFKGDPVEDPIGFIEILSRNIGFTFSEMVVLACFGPELKIADEAKKLSYLYRIMTRRQQNLMMELAKEYLSGKLLSHGAVADLKLEELEAYGDTKE